jgi:hypothetical protein
MKRLENNDDHNVINYSGTGLTKRLSKVRGTMKPFNSGRLLLF